VRRVHNGKPDKSFCFCYDHQGKKHWETVGWASRGITAAYANQVRIDILNKLRFGENPALLNGRKSFTFGQAAEAWLVWAKGEGRATKPEEDRYRIHLKTAFADLPIELITPEMLDQLKTELSVKLAPGTVKKVFELMRGVINFAIKRKLWQGVNPVSNLGGFTMPKVDNKGERFLSPEEAQKLLAELEKRSPVWRDMAFLSLYTGLRLTEIIRLRGQDIDEKSLTAIVTAKGGQREPVLLTPEALTVLTKHRRGADAYVFRDSRGKPFTVAGQPFLAAVKACAFNDEVSDRRHRVWFHTLRHTFASWLAQSGVDIYALMKLMRHKRVEMTQRYAHLIPDRQREHLAIIHRTLLQKAGL
jgi:integrase